MKKISILIALILILGFANQSFAYYEYNLSTPFSCWNYIFHNKIRMSLSSGCEIYYAWHNNLSVKHKFTYDMAKKMLKHPNTIYPIKYEEILASYIYKTKIDNLDYHSPWSNLNYHFWLEKAEIQNFFEHEINENINKWKWPSQNINMSSYFIKLIKDNKKFHNYYVKYSPLFPLAKLDEQKILAAKRGKVLSAIAKEKALLGNNRYKAINIMNNYCLRHNNCSVGYNDTTYTNNGMGYDIYTSADFVLTVPFNAPDDFIITKSLFSTQLQHQLVFMLKQNGFSNASTMNLTTAFVSYITQPPNKKSFFYRASRYSKIKFFNKHILNTTQGLTNMVATGDLKDFNELVNLFTRHLIKINK